MHDDFPPVSLIVAMAENRVIGRGGSIPWHIPADLRRFRELTMGHPLIVGRKTFESIGRTLPGRTMIVLSRQKGYHPAGCLVAHDLAEAFLLSKNAEEVFIGGGGEVYRESLPFAGLIYLTLLHRTIEGDATFPEIPPEFVETARQDVPGEPACSFLTYERTHRR